MIGSSQLTIPSYNGVWAREPGDVVDWARELRRRALGLWVPCLGPTGGQIIDLSSRQDHAVIQGSVGTAVAERGWARTNDGNTGKYATTTLTPSSYLTPAEATIFCVFNSTSGSADPFGSIGSSAGRRFQLGLTSGGALFSRFDSSADLTASTDIRGSRLVAAAGCYPGGVGQLWRDGLLVASGTTASGSFDASIPAPSLLARRSENGTHSRAINGGVAIAAVWPWALDAVTLARLTLDPLALVRWHGRRSWLVQGHAGSGDEGRTADLAAVESGDDACTVDVAVAVAGDLIAAETGADAATLDAVALVSGDLVAAETGADGATLDATVLVLGDLSVAETGADALVADVGVLVSADMAAAEEGADTFAATVGQVLGATLSAIEIGDDGFAGSAQVRVDADLQVTEVGADSAAASVTVTVSAGLAVAETGADTMTGIVGEPPDTVVGAVFASPVFRSRVVTGVAS